MSGGEQAHVDVFYLFEPLSKATASLLTWIACAKYSSDTFRAHAASEFVYVSIYGGGHKMLAWQREM